MDNLIYIGSLILLALLTFTFNRANYTKLMFLAVAVGAYIVYSHETGHSATEFKDKMIKSVDKSAEKFVDRYDSDIKDAEKVKKESQK
ncbi:MAG: hypothetical protein NTW78_01060 [Campylobacterales bacterium]|nr:hypothetical protein [Campylobacterales bacterium]